MPRRTSPTSPLVALLLVGLGLALVGCLPGDSPVTPPPTSDAEPVFASDEEALAAAEEAYGAYLATVDAILADGGTNPERLEPLASANLYAREASGFADMVAKDWHGTGSRTFSLSLQSFDDVEVVVYSCEDISGTDVVDADGISVVTSERPDHYPFEVSLGVRDERLIVESKEVWAGDGVC